MNNRKVFLGRNAEEKPILVALELHTDQKQISIRVFPRDSITDEFVTSMSEEWEKGNDVEFPVEPEVISRGAEEEHILPESIKTDRPEMLRRLKNEWTLKMLSVRLYENFNEKIADLKSKTDQAEGYTQEFWDQAKKMWDDVGEHAKDFNLSKKHTGELRDNLNKVFESLKSQRDKGQEEFEKISKVVREKYENTLEEVKSGINNSSRLNELFDRLKGIQKDIKEANLTHRDRRGLWKNLDNVFNKVKSEKQNIWKSHLGNRIGGLRRAMEKMQNSIDRDRESIDYQQRQLERHNMSQIAQQLLSTKLKVIQDRIKSKEEKLAEMDTTLQSLLNKQTAQEAKDKAAAAAAALAIEKATAEKAAEAAAKKTASADKLAESRAQAQADSQAATDDMLAEAAKPAKTPKSPASEVDEVAGKEKADIEPKKEVQESKAEVEVKDTESPRPENATAESSVAGNDPETTAAKDADVQVNENGSNAEKKRDDATAEAADEDLK